MANAPSTSSYVLLASEPIDLPNGQVLTATAGLEIQSGGSSGNVLISPSLGLDSIVQLSTSGLSVYDALTTTFTTTSLQTDGTISIDNADGLDGPPTLGVVTGRTVQLIKGSANGGSSVGAYPELHFTGSGVASCSVTADAGNNRLVVNYSVADGAAGEGTVTSVGLESSGNTLSIGGTNPVTSSGIIDVNLPALGVAGTYMNPQITVDNYGRITGASSGSGGNGTVTSVGVTSTNGSLSVSGSPVTSSGNINVQMPTTGVTAGTYTNTTLSVDGFGRITSAANGATSTSTYTIRYTTAQTITLPTNCIAIDILIIGAGGTAGSNTDINGGRYYGGGSGSGGNSAACNKIPLIAGKQLVFSLDTTAGTGYAQISVDSSVLCQVYNGNKGGNSTSSAGGSGGTVNSTASVVDSTYGVWATLSGSAGSAGSLGDFNSYNGIATTAGTPKGSSFTDGGYGCGQRCNQGTSVNAPASTARGYGVLYVTYYLI